MPSAVSRVVRRRTHVRPRHRTPRRNRALWSALLAAAVSGGAATVHEPVGPAAAAERGCGVPGYSYAGYREARAEHGVRATLVQIVRPQIDSGHVGAWVGVGGPGQGPGGSDAWIQIGLASLTDGVTRIFVEVNEPGPGIDDSELGTGVSVGAEYRIAVLEISSRPGWWRVWLNGRPASTPVHLPGSSGRWQPTATAETWDGGRRVCNQFAYRFKSVDVASARGGGWSRFVVGERFEDPGYRVLRERRDAFATFSAGMALRISSG